MAEKNPTINDLGSPEDFDLAAWVAGFQPTRKGCTIYSRSDLLAELDFISERISNQPLGDEGREELVEQAKEIADELAASGVEFTVQALTQEARRNSAKAAGIEDPKDVTVEQNLSLLAAHIVSPKGVTVEQLKVMYEAAPQQIEKLARTVNTVDDIAPGVPSSFSRRS